ncbi:MAG: hypothetical protein D6730_09935 [Bacteroidetes bacterium]|nr:MAG: hypothetical protein D6730_09935 [Bacteroidota bacterium]
MKYLLAAICWALLWSHTLAQEEWFPSLEAVSEEELHARPVHAASAPYLILHDYGRLAFEAREAELLLRYDYYRRLKVLDAAAFPPIEITVQKRMSRESVSHIRLCVHRIGEAGSLQTLLQQEARVEVVAASPDRIQYHLLLPPLQAGDLITYSYTLHSADFFQLRSWHFQQEAEVLKSEFHTFVPHAYLYLAVFQGNEALLQKYQQPFEAGSRVYRGYQLNLPFLWRETSIGRNSRHLLNLSGTHASFFMEAVPPLRTEPYMPPNRAWQLQFQLKYLNISRHLRRRVIAHWNDFNAFLLGHERLGRQMRPGHQLREQHIRPLRQLCRDLHTPAEKLAAIQAYARKLMQWDGTYSIMATSVERALENRRGNSAEMNLLLIQLLRLARLKASPVLIATRDHALLNPEYPFLHQFNHLIVAVKEEAGYLLADALNHTGIPDMLPPADLNEIGYLLNERKAEWIPIVPAHALSRNTHARLHLNEAGELHGEVHTTFRGYAASLGRAQLQSLDGQSGSMDLGNWFVFPPGSSISTPETVGWDQQEAPLKLRFSVAIEGAKHPDGLLIIQPVGLPRLPVLFEEGAARQQAVSLPFPIKTQYSLVLELPQDLEVVQLPENLKLELPGGGGTFEYELLHIEGLLRIATSFNIHQTYFLPPSHSQLQHFLHATRDKLEEGLIFRYSSKMPLRN